MARTKRGRGRVRRARSKAAGFMGLSGDMSQVLIAPKRKMRTARSWALSTSRRYTSHRLFRRKDPGGQSLD